MWADRIARGLLVGVGLVNLAPGAAALSASNRAVVVEAVTEGGVAAGDPAYFALDDVFAENGDNAGQGPNPANALGRKRRLAPAHRLGPGK